MKLKSLLDNFAVEVTGFPAFVELKKHSREFGEQAVLSTLPAAVLVSQGVTEYYAPIIPRNSKFLTAEDILNTDLDVKKYKITTVNDKLDLLAYANPIDTVIVSRHKGTVDYLLKDYNDSNAPRVLDGDVSVEDVKGKHIIGTLPPHLVSECDYYTAVSIKDFDYAVDGDLKGIELEDRVTINNPIKLENVDIHFLEVHWEDIYEPGYGGTTVYVLENIEEVLKEIERAPLGMLGVTYTDSDGKIFRIPERLSAGMRNEEVLEEFKNIVL